MPLQGWDICADRQSGWASKHFKTRVSSTLIHLLSSLTQWSQSWIVSSTFKSNWASPKFQIRILNIVFGPEALNGRTRQLWTAQIAGCLANFKSEWAPHSVQYGCHVAGVDGSMPGVGHLVNSTLEQQQSAARCFSMADCACLVCQIEIRRSITDQSGINLLIWVSDR